ncbi:VOC family protein [Oceanobacillus luteolus]|uniref:VOC family protein n=1 Tax=Oceanobacillus luteolus TaxID=1274358 RepID=A0ABW4HNA0_9BACI|nr:VOC family protein [Oceanobacillus luteolus]MCM3739423.1 VOC family protein [Oceanobacillus luteolus]
MILGVHPYIRTNGNGQEVVKFYENALEAEVLGVQTYGDFPENPEFPLSDEMKALVAHAQLKIGESYLMISDNFPEEPYQIGEQLNIALLFKDVEKVKVIFEKLQDGGEVILPLQETPFSPAYGQVKDKYSITWQISTVGE